MLLVVFLNEGVVMKLGKLLGAALLLGSLGLLMTACKKDEPGPAEALGKKIDGVVQSANEQAAALAGKAQESMKDSSSDTGKKIDEALDSAKSVAKDLAEKAGEKLQSAGKKIEEAGKDAQK
jgi:hypothetical protein